MTPVQTARFYSPFALIFLVVAVACASDESSRGGSLAEDADAAWLSPVADAAVDASDVDADAVEDPDADAGTAPDEASDAGDDDADDAPDAESPQDGLDAGADDDAGSAVAGDGLCETYSAEPTETAKLQDERLTGVSGIAASRLNAGILWIHNDYAGQVTVYAVEASTGVTRGVLIAPEGVTASNLEGMAIARCPNDEGGEANAADSADPDTDAAQESSCLWLADSGNNLKTRTDLSVVVLPEPLLSNADATGDSAGNDSGTAVSAPESWTASKAWRFAFAYPGDNVDAEAFAVEPDGSAFYFLEKVDADMARLFEARGPFADGDFVALEEIGALAAQKFIITPTLGKMMTGADLHPSRRRFVMRSYIGSFEYRFESDDWAREIPGVTPEVVAWGPLSEPQGEAITYGADGKSLWTVSEDPDQAPGQGIHFYPCLDAAAE